MDESVREMAVADLVADVRRLSTLEREFLDRWRAALNTMSGTPQLARVFDRVKLLASVEAQAQRDEDAALLAVLEQVEFECESPAAGRPAAERNGRRDAARGDEAAAPGSTATPNPVEERRRRSNDQG